MEVQSFNTTYHSQKLAGKPKMKKYPQFYGNIQRHTVVEVSLVCKGLYAFGGRQVASDLRKKCPYQVIDNQLVILVVLPC
ncbi:MAG: hypothetical protein ACKO96_04370 [Flammeovirgaceae bacterium]